MVSHLFEVVLERLDERLFEKFQKDSSFSYIEFRHLGSNMYLDSVCCNVEFSESKERFDLFSFYCHCCESLRYSGLFVKRTEFHVSVGVQLE